MSLRGGQEFSANGTFRVLRRVCKAALGLAALLVIVWSFLHVAWREGSRLLSRPNSTVLTVMHWSGDGGPEEDEMVERSMRAFEAAHPGITVRRINPGDMGSFYTKLQTMFAAGEPPDLFYLGAERVASFASLGLVAPLDAFVEADASSSDPRALHLDAFFPNCVEAFRYDGTGVGRGPLYGVPKDFTTIGFYYNKSLFDAAGVPYPKADWTWEDFVATARGLKRLDGVVGAEFVTWPMVLRAYLRSEGVEARGKDFDDVRLRDEGVFAALDRLRSWRHDEANTLTGGKSKLASGGPLFTTGRVGMVGPFGRWQVPQYRKITAFDWDFAPMPRGAARENIVITVAWSVASQSRHKSEAWKLARWLTSPESQAEQSRLGLAIPTLRAVAESDAFLDPNALPANDAAFLVPLRDPSYVAKVIDWPADATYEQLLGSRLDAALLTGARSLEDAIGDFERAWTQHRDSPLARGKFEPFPWSATVGVMSVLLGVGAIAAVVFYARGPGSRSARREERAGLLMVSPWLVGFALFLAVPIATSLFLSLSAWKGLSTLDQARYVGTTNYVQLLGHDERFWRSLWVTVYYVLVAVPAGQLFALLAALLMNSKVRGIGFYRAAWYLPSVLSGVGVAVLWRWVFDPEVGLMNAILSPLFGLVGLSLPEWFGKDAAWLGPPAFAIMTLWSVGGSMMIYLAGLQNIPQDLHEAAEIDGVGRVRRFFSITLPMLSPVILFNALMALIAGFQVFTQAFVMTSGEPGDLTRFYALYLYNQAFDLYAMGYASAMAWILLVIILGVTLLLMRTSARYVYYEGLRS
ncbi:MAG: extracellular solute-binding protein [Phycisphaerae bacterium]|jgi:multiple sugar transport system permease protein|nr:extracellular solute-binding protein [Phycisphaerae bacterium]